MSRKIVVEKYNENWPIEFEKLKKKFEKALNELDYRIEHVGSTSVPGLAAKPILDIDIIVKNKETMERVIERIESIGYKHQGDWGVPGREVFKYKEGFDVEDEMEHHLYACIDGIDSLKNHLNLKKYLSSNPEAVKEYGELKKKLAKKYPEDIDSYVDGKTDLIVSFLAKMGMNEDSLTEISDVNKKK